MKKFNFLRYIFIIFVVILIGYSIYYIKGQEKEQEEVTVVEQEKIEEKTKIATLRLAAVNPDTLNPILSHNQNVQDISKLIHSSMLTVTDKFEIEKCLAKEWVILSDTEYVVVLKSGIMWKEGNTLTANDIKYTIEKIQEIGENSIYFANVSHIASVEILSEYTVKIVLDQKIPFFEYNLTFPIMSAEYFNSESMIDNDKAYNPPGLGQYKITSITPTEIELKKNENWWGITEGKQLSLETILVKIYSSMGEVYNAFKSGNLDLITTQNLNYEEYIGTIGYKTAEYFGREHVYLAMNCETGILKYKELRQAVNYAIDKSNIIATVFENKYYISDFPLNTSNYLYNIEKVSSSFNTNKSREVLENNGWNFQYNTWTKQDEFNYTIRAKINFVVNQEDENRLKVAEIIKKQLEDLGISINLIKVKTNQYNQYLQNKNYDMILTGKLNGISPDLSSYIMEGNLSNYIDDEATELLNTADKIKDNNEEVIAKYKKIIKLIEDDRPFTSLYFNKNIIIYNEELQGKISPNYYSVFYGIENWIREY